MIEIDYRDEGDYFKGMKKPEREDSDCQEYWDLFGELEDYEGEERARAYSEDPNGPPEYLDWYGAVLDEDDYDEDDEEYLATLKVEAGKAGISEEDYLRDKAASAFRDASPQEQGSSPNSAKAPQDEEPRVEGVEDPVIVRSREMIAQSQRERMARLEQMWIDREVWLRKRTQKG